MKESLRNMRTRFARSSHKTILTNSDLRLAAGNCSLQTDDHASVPPTDQELVKLMITKTVPDLATIEGMLDEVGEFARGFEAARRKLKQHRTGSAAYYELLPDLSVQLDVLRLKAKHASQALDQYQESLPTDD